MTTAFPYAFLKRKRTAVFVMTLTWSARFSLRCFYRRWPAPSFALDFLLDASRRGGAFCFRGRETAWRDMRSGWFCRHDTPDEVKTPHCPMMLRLPKPGANAWMERTLNISPAGGPYMKEIKITPDQMPQKQSPQPDGISSACLVGGFCANLWMFVTFCSSGILFDRESYRHRTEYQRLPDTRCVHLRGS